MIANASLGAYERSSPTRCDRGHRAPVRGMESNRAPPILCVVRDTPTSSDVAAAYDRWAAVYDADKNATRDLDALVVRRAPIALDGRDVLELGCGTGKNTTHLAATARRVVALDFSEGMIARAHERIVTTNVEFVKHDVREVWPVPSASFDVVIGNLILEHVHDLAIVFFETARVLRSGGQAFFCELHPYRQLQGGQAQFTDPRTGERVQVAAHVHTVSEYVNGGIEAGLELRGLGEWIEEGAPEDAAPRLFSLLFHRG
jgi:ubiquinone/menaquinone biosynthesis C-methylase UbiE